MPRQVGIPLGILQALYHKAIALPQFDATTFSQGSTLLNDLLVQPPIDGEGDVFLLYGGVYHDFLSLLHLVCMQGYREGKQLGDAIFSEAASTMDSITSGTGLAPLKSSQSSKVLVIGVFLPHSYDALIAQVVAVFEHQQGSHLPDGMTR
jgi:hypothetical protein